MIRKPKKTVKFSSFISPHDIISDVGSRDRDAAFMELLTLLAMNKGIGNVREVFKDVVARENAGSTIVADGIAIPHARIEGLTRLTVGVAVSRRGIPFCEGRPPVRLIVLILAPKDAPALYLQALGSVSRILSSTDFPAVIDSFSSADDIWRFFDREGLILPGYVCARDIMEPVRVKLTETDTLKKAIDLFVRHAVTEIPVVDKEGDLVGIVSAYELLKVCLPDYILWMDDVSPIVNFEPFADVLRNETSTWLADIMSYDYATVGEEAPAVQVGKEIAKFHTEHVFVLHGKKLTGTISLENFLYKVLRE